ncbi:MAG TPA: STN and carboxypeptidase regulatory-like domain-containing protein [Chitinophagaceae bacterium]|jgi:carboxypeptidase-like protein|nr:STN and carboxypeptidase regulatory-like domain-containing protein [Chitinophagaceae bacterium]
MKKIVSIVFLVAGISVSCVGQALLSKNITLDVDRQRLDNVLEILSNKGDFYFSYNSKIVKKDSLVSLNVRNKTVKEALGLLFNSTYEFVESGNYVIIRKAPIRMTMVTNKAVVEDKIYSVSGYVFDEQSGVAINEASVYEKKQLASALTNDAGYFKLKLKSSKTSSATLFISKEFYEDTSIVIEPRHNQELTITMMPVEKEVDKVTVAPEDYLVPDSLKRNADTVSKTIAPPADSAKVERTGMGRFLLSTKQQVQSLNLKHFFTTRPFQVSLTPGLSSQGKMSGQVVNNFSLNVLGGYTAGTNGVEIGGIFNIDKKEVKYFQAAGVFNVDGGKMKGFQVAGVNNTVLDTSYGFQAAGINNLVKGKFAGFQVGGVYNHVADSVTGVQAAGVANFARRKLSGVQIAGVGNVSNKETGGVQIAGVFNYSKKLKGVQIGLINIADTSEGYSIGLINVIIKGYHKVSFSTNEIVNVNAAFKTGNSRLYSILQAGVNAGSSNRVYSFGYGLGSELNLNKGKTLSLNPELTSQYLYLGSWDYTNILNRIHLNFNVKLGKYVSLFAGPAFSVYISDQKTGLTDYRFPIPPSGYNVISFSDRVTGWFGWNAGINFF